MDYGTVCEGQRLAVRWFGKALGRAAEPGDVIALTGDLGAGKTLLAGAIARGLGVPPSVRVASPTFTVMLEHQGRIPLVHADLYRLEGEDSLRDIGVFERALDGLCVVEWAERCAGAVPSDALWLRLEVTGPRARRITARGEGPRAQRLVAAARSA